jgi:magnesium-transporting ATPase (P-type)
LICNNAFAVVRRWQEPEIRGEGCTAPDLLAIAAGRAANIGSKPARTASPRKRRRRGGFRALGIAWRNVGEHTHAVAVDERDLVFAGVATFLDPRKESAGPAIATLAASDVGIKILTGDNERVTRHICAELGIPIAGVLTGAELGELARLDGINLLCRVRPTQKNRRT